MLMEIKNEGKRRIRLGKHLYINPGQIMEVSDELGSFAVRKHADIKGKIIKPKIIKKSKPKVEVKINFDKPKEDEINDIE